MGVIAWELVSDVNPWGANVDGMRPYDVLQLTNRTSSLDRSVRPPHMSKLYFDFISKVVSGHKGRATVEEAMGHDLFRGLDFADPASLFPSMSVHRDLVTLAPVLYGIKGTQQKKNADDKAFSPAVVSRQLCLQSEEADLQKEINTAVTKLECWQRQQQLIPSEEDLTKIERQNDALRTQLGSEEVMKMPKRGKDKPPNRHRKVSKSGSGQRG